MATKNTQPLRTCLICGDEVKEKDCYKSRNTLINEKISVCKVCSCKHGNQSIENFHKILVVLDIPFLPDLYKMCEGSENIMSDYMLRVNNPNKKTDDGKKICEMNYCDSPTHSPVTDVDGFLVSNDDNRLENIIRWGEHYTDAEYMKMNTSVENNIKITGRDDYSSIKSFERVARAEVQVDRIYANNELKQNDRKSAEDTLTSTLRQAGLSYEQITKSNTDSTLGTDIRDVIENFEPVPEPSDQFKDVDMVGEYVTRFILKPLLRSVGKDNSSIIDEFKAIKDEIKSRATKWLKEKSRDKK